MVNFYTYSEKEIDLENMNIDDIEIRDIAHALANINRFNGMTKVPFSVAQHSVFVAHLCRGPNEMQALLHDASEAYLGDVTIWLKRSQYLKDYLILESYIQNLIFEKFDCNLKLAQEVKYADKLMVQFEAIKGFKNFQFNDGYSRNITKTKRDKIGAWIPWSWQIAEVIFLDEFDRIKK